VRARTGRRGVKLPIRKLTPVSAGGIFLTPGQTLASLTWGQFFGWTARAGKGAMDNGTRGVDAHTLEARDEGQT